MIEFTVQTEIARPVREVFAYATDPSKLATWQTNTISAVAEQEGRWAWERDCARSHRAPGGKELASLVAVSEYESIG